MLNFRHVVALFSVGMLAILVQNGAHSQLRTVEIAPEVQATPPVVARVPEVIAEQDETRNRFYDTRNPDHQKLQKMEDILVTLPKDKRGKIDWMSALRSGAITPRSDLNGNTRSEVFDLDIILKNTKEMPYVKFPHNSHTEWLACSNCHDKLFVPKAGANPITMEKIFRGEYCGTCHDRVAFVTHYSCERCHSVAHGKVKAWW
jgi:c(7)-type cytochrome triheme protein